ncbi:MAG: hypothetical protein OSB19_19305, partial [Opitutaceae bacterium]|nr:hypothetical protein [Opitutaceae bacterium]
WKLVRPTGFQNTARLEDVPFELYHIASDPGEKEELSATNPEVVKRLTKAYDQWFADVSTTRADNFAKANIILGKEAPAITFLTKQEWRPTEGSSWGTQGFWQLKATEDCVYTVETIFEEPVEGKLTLIVGDATYNKNIRKKELQNSFEFSEISIPAGPFKLECFIEVDGKKTAVYHIDLRKE